PDFTWPPQNGANTYTVSLTFPDAHVERIATGRNWLAWPRVLPAGDYRWEVRVAGHVNDVGEARQFTVAANATPFVVPSGSAALARAKSTPRPRTWTHDDSGPIAAVKAERASGLRDLLGQVEARMRD